MFHVAQINTLKNKAMSSFLSYTTPTYANENRIATKLKNTNIFKNNANRKLSNS